jgi:hypothetical protein
LQSQRLSGFFIIYYLFYFYFSIRLVEIFRFFLLVSNLAIFLFIEFSIFRFFIFSIGFDLSNTNAILQNVGVNGCRSTTMQSNVIHNILSSPSSLLLLFPSPYTLLLLVPPLIWFDTNYALLGTKQKIIHFCLFLN